MMKILMAKEFIFIHERLGDDVDAIKARVEEIRDVESKVTPLIMKLGIDGVRVSGIAIICLYQLFSALL